MALINSSDSLVVLLRLFQFDFFYPDMGLVSGSKEKIERCEFLSTVMMTAGRRKLQNQLEKQYVARSIFRLLSFPSFACPAFRLERQVVFYSCIVV